MSIAVYVLARYAIKPRPAPLPAGVIIELLRAEATRQFRKHKGAVLAAALVAGLLAGQDEE